MPLQIERDLSTVISLACYFDDSITQPDLQIHVVAGYIAPAWCWERDFAPAWKRIIDNAPHPISEVKTADCRGGYGEFKRPWTKEQRDKLIRDCITVIQDTPCLIGLASAFIWPGTPDPATQKKKRTKDRKFVQTKAYQVCVGYCLDDAIKLCMEGLAVDEIQPVIDRKAKFARIVSDNFDLILKSLPAEFAEKIAPPVHLDSKEILPLQAADLFAHETLREVCARCDEKEPRRDLIRLLSAGVYGGRVFVMPPHDLYNLIKLTGKKVKPSKEILFESDRGRVKLRTQGQWRVDD